MSAHRKKKTTTIWRKPASNEVEREADLKQTCQWRMCTKLKPYLVGASQNKMAFSTYFTLTSLMWWRGFFRSETGFSMTKKKNRILSWAMSPQPQVNFDFMLMLNKNFPKIWSSIEWEIAPNDGDKKNVHFPIGS